MMAGLPVRRCDQRSRHHRVWLLHWLRGNSDRL